MIKYVNDIAGIRIICSFTSDIYRIAEMIGEQKDIKILCIKDYITYPKASGYKSYHMLVSVPVYLSNKMVATKVEIQIRTVAMDFWASLEHKMHYKFEGDAPEHIKAKLIECAKMVSDLDARAPSRRFIHKTVVPAACFNFCARTVRSKRKCFSGFAGTFA